MPNYDYLCSACGETTSRMVSFSRRETPTSCAYCSEAAQYQFPVEAAQGIQMFEEQYCEPLGCDVTSERDMITKAKKLGFIPAGDKVRGGRKEHDVLAPTLKRRGVSIDDKLRERDIKAEQKETWHSFAQSGDAEKSVKETDNLKNAIKVRHVTARNR